MLRSILVGLCFVAFLAPASAQNWQPVTEALIAAEKPGYGKLCGVVVDHATGDVIVNLSDKGLYRSSDQGGTWKPLGTPFKGRTEWPGCLMLDPLGGKRLVGAFVYGSPILVSPDQGKTLKPLDKKSEHVDWCAVDWSDPDLKFMLALKHEAQGLLLASHDGGLSFDKVGIGYGPAWIFDNQTAVVAYTKPKAKTKPSLMRTTDGGRSFDHCGQYTARALPKWHKDTLYWVVDGALISTKDQGKSWTKISDLQNGRLGPIFGKSADQMFVLTQAGIVESTDAGQSWSKAIAAPKGMGDISTLTWMDFDPVHDTLYLMKMTSELYRWQRK